MIKNQNYIKVRGKIKIHFSNFYVGYMQLTLK